MMNPTEIFITNNFLEFITTVIPYYLSFLEVDWNSTRAR
jgi:hypothetical protein